jgi:hypothetical protein
MKNYSLKNKVSKLTLIVSAIFMILSVYSCKMLADMTPTSLENTTWSGRVKYKEKVNGAVVNETECEITFSFANGYVSGYIKRLGDGIIIKKILHGTYTFEKGQARFQLNWGNSMEASKAMLLIQNMLWTDETGSVYTLALQ